MKLENLQPELVSFKVVETMLGRTRKWVYERLRTDSKFPRPLQISAHSVAFRRSEILAWIDDLPRAQLDGLSAIDRRKVVG